MALEWSHWLEGAEQPFSVWTDHKSLEYLHTAKCLNSRQVRWAVLFTCLHFTISYCPGSKNVKLTHSHICTAPQLHHPPYGGGLTRLCPCSCSGMGTFLETHLSSWLPLDLDLRPTTSLVAHHGS